MIDHIRKTSEAIILLLVVVSPWTFGSVHPFFRYCLTAGIGMLLLLWSVELVLSPRRIVSRFQLPLALYVLVVALQLLPLGTIADTISPHAGSLKEILLPAQRELLADGTEAREVTLSARGRLSLYPAETLHRFYWIALLALLFTRVQDLASTTTLRHLCYACLINGGALAFFSVVQHFTAPQDGVVFWTYQSRGAAFGPFINRNHFAFYLNICFGLALGLLGSRQMGKFNRFTLENVIDSLKDSLSLWMVSILVFMLGAVILCSSRSGLISLAGAMIITVIFVASTGTFRRGWRWFLLAGCIFGLAASLQMWLGFDFVSSRYALFEDNRTEVWLPLLKIVRDFPLLGTGVGTLARIEPLTRETGAARDFYLEYAHNEYLQLLLETGIAGLLCGATLLWMLAAKISRRIRGSRHNAWLYVGLLFSLAAVALHSFTEFGLAIPSIAFLAVVMAGHIAGLGHVKPRPAEKLFDKVCYRAAAVVIVIVGFLAMRDAKLSDLAERYFVAAQRAHNQGDVAMELESLESALSYTPDNIELLMDSSRLLLEADPLAMGKQSLLLKAQNDLVAAREICPLASDAHFLIGLHVDTFQQAEAALVHYERARTVRPADATLAFLTGRQYLEEHDLDRAVHHFHSSLSLAPTHLDAILPLIADQTELDRDLLVEKLLPSDPLVLWRAGIWFAERDEMEVKTDLLQKALRTDQLSGPSSGEDHFLKGTILVDLDDFQGAVKSYRTAVLYSPDNLDWQLRLVRLLVDKVHQPGEALKRIRQIRQQYPGHAEAARLRDRAIELKSSE